MDAAPSTFSAPAVPGEPKQGILNRFPGTSGGMGVPTIRTGKYHGKADLGTSQYVAMYLAQAGWIALGVYLLKNAYWPSSCQPLGPVEVFTCSVRLPESRDWIEAALFTWLWSTPILVLLDLSRRYSVWAARRRR
jgi:hypothetical protein